MPLLSVDPHVMSAEHLNWFHCNLVLGGLNHL